ncbi:TraR/DksA family transcriptional regulator [Photorhabdus temperata subsp. temperata]
MPDFMDLIQQRQAEALDRQIRGITDRQIGISVFKCDDCGSAISEERRRAIAGVTHCVTCQSILELKNKHYRSV